MDSFRKAYGALKDSTTVGLAKVNSDYKDLDVAVVKATNHVEYPPKERHMRKIFSATSVGCPRTDVAYCILSLSRRLAKTRSWIVAIKTLIVIHRALRESDPTFREELLNYSNRGHVLQISNFKDDSSPLAWDCSAWIRSYALFLEERLECFRILKYDVETEHVGKISPKGMKAPSRTRALSREELLEQLPALQQLLYRLINCQPEGLAFTNNLVQYALALVLKESFKIYCAINDGIINLVDKFFDMSRHDAVRALNIYRKAGQQAENLAHFYEFCKRLDLARNFQFPTLRQPPPSFLTTMEEYIREAPHTASVASKKLEYQEREQITDRPEEPSPSESVEPAEEVDEKAEPVDTTPEPEVKSDVEQPPLISETDNIDLLGLDEVHPRAAELEEQNALALAIVPPDNDTKSSAHHGLNEFGGSDSSGWELALVSKPSNIVNPSTETKLAGGFDKLLLDSLYGDDNARRQLQLQNAGYGYGSSPLPNPFDLQHDPFSTSNGIAPPTGVQMAMMSQQQMMFQQQQATALHNPQQQMQQSSSSNPFGDPFHDHLPQGGTSNQGNDSLL